MPFKTQCTVFNRLEEIGNLLTLDSVQRRQYDNSLDNFRDNAATMAYAESVAREEGMEKGREEGISKATYKIAKSLKSLNTNIEIIVSVTGLTIEEIDNL